MSKSGVQFVIMLCAAIFVSTVAEAKGVEDMLVDFSDYLSTRLIPSSAMVGVGVGGIMSGLGSPKGVEVVKYSIIGGVIGTAGATTLSALFF